MSATLQPLNNEQQIEIPFAIVDGASVTTLPQDLYIPPDALEVFLESFEGPLDFLLYLIKRHQLDVLDIPIAEITRQYMVYVELMKEIRLELAAEYLVMAAVLAEIKSRMLLPRPQHAIEEEDPRAELVRRLQEYERYKQAAEDLNALPQVGRDIYLAVINNELDQSNKPLPIVSWPEILRAMQEVMRRVEMFSHHHIQLEPLSVRERMSHILSVIDQDRFIDFTSLFTITEGRRGVVVTFLAILELVKQNLIDIVQNEPFGSIYVKLPNSSHGSEST